MKGKSWVDLSAQRDRSWVDLVANRGHRKRGYHGLIYKQIKGGGHRKGHSGVYLVANRGHRKRGYHGLIYMQIKGHRKGAFRSRSSGRSGAQKEGTVMGRFNGSELGTN
jgi:hypothetical protein